MDILYLVPHVPNPTKARSYFQIRGLIEAGHQVTVATLRRSVADDQKLAELQKMGAKVIFAALSPFQSLTNTLINFPSRKPLQTSFMWSSRLMKRIKEHIKTQPPDIIHVEHLRMTRYGFQLMDQYPVVWDAVDFLAPLFQEASHTSASLPFRVISHLEAPRLEAYEKWLVGQFPRTLVISKHDQALFRQNTQYAERVLVTMAGLPIEEHRLNDNERASNVLIMTGTLNYHPNVASAQYFVHDILPIVRQQNPNVRLQLVGANPSPSIQALASENIEVTGFVPSITSYLSSATVALAPVIYAAGMQNKVLEAFLTATPVVATSVAVRGLDVQHEREVLIAATPTDFANAIMRLLSDPALRQSIGAAGRKYIELNHDLRTTTSHLVDIYEQVVLER